MSEYFLKLKCLGANMKIELYLSNYGTNYGADYKNATVVDTPDFAKRKLI